MTARGQILSLLRGPVASRIRFTFPFWAGTVTIAAASFQRVARAIESGQVRIDVTTAFSANVGAEYISGTPNRLRVPPITGRVQEGLVLHECTHAVFDLTKTQVTANDEEAAAYVVDALYFRMTGLRRPRWNAEPHATAGNVADVLLREYQAGKVAVPALDPDRWNALRVQVMLHPVYIAGDAGIPGVLLGTGYVNDG